MSNTICFHCGNITGDFTWDKYDMILLKHGKVKPIGGHYCCEPCNKKYHVVKKNG